MNPVNWKKIALIVLAAFVLLQLKHVWGLIKEESYDLINDAYDYVWALPQGLRFALLSAFFLMLFMAVFRILMKERGGDDKWTK